MPRPGFEPGSSAIFTGGMRSSPRGSVLPKRRSKGRDDWPDYTIGATLCQLEV